MRRIAIFLAFALVLAVTSALHAQQRTLVTIGVSEGTDRTKNYGPLEKHLNVSATCQYVFKRFDTAELLLAAFQDRTVDLALLGPMNYVRARAAFGAIPIVTDGKQYQSVIIVPDDSVVKSISGLAGLRLAFAYDQSMSGHLLPLLRLSRVGIRAPKLVAGCAKRTPGVACYDFLGSHNAVARAIQDGKYDAGGVIDEVAARTKGIRVIDRSDPFPAVPLCAHPKTDSRILDDVRARILAYKAPAGSGTHPFAGGAVAVSDADFNQVRFLAKVILGESYH